jgi:hypothetical protein
MVRSGFSVNKGCQIFLATTYQSWENIPNNQKIHIPNSHKIYPMAVCKIYQMLIKNTNLFLYKTIKKYPNFDFWFENIPSGNPDPSASPDTAEKNP